MGLAFFLFVCFWADSPPAGRFLALYGSVMAVGRVFEVEKAGRRVGQAGCECFENTLSAGECVKQNGHYTTENGQPS